MKTGYRFLPLLIWLGLFSSSSKESKDNSPQSWKEMNALEVTMEKSFRPLKDSSAVDAATRMMPQIATEAERLSSSSLPEKMNNEEIKKKLEKLKTDTRALANEIAAGTEDDVIGTEFYKLHDLFLEIKQAWEN